MTVLVSDRELGTRLRAERAASGADRWDEVWDGVYVIMPMPDDEHQQIATGLASILYLLLTMAGEGEVRAGVNVSDRADDWTKNYRVPDVAVFLRGTAAVNRGTFWLGGPDFAVEVLSDDDRAREKFAFHAGAGVRELLLIGRDPWGLELYRLADGRLDPVGRSTLDQPHLLSSEVVPLSFRLAAGEPRPAIEVSHADGQRRWTI